MNISVHVAGEAEAVVREATSEEEKALEDVWARTEAPAEDKLAAIEARLEMLEGKASPGAILLDLE